MGFLGNLLGIVVAVLVGAAIVQVAVLFIAGFKPKYGNALLAVSLAAVMSIFIGFVVAIATSGGGYIFSIVASFLVQVFIYSNTIQSDGGDRLSFGTAAAVSLIQFALGAVLYFALNSII